MLVRYRSLCRAGEWVDYWAGGRAETARVVTPNELLNAGGDGTEWLTYGHDYAETHFSPLNQINKKNVKRLSLAWSSTTDAPQGTVEATPLSTTASSTAFCPGT